MGSFLAPEREFQINNSQNLSLKEWKLNKARLRTSGHFFAALRIYGN